jgi:ABC-type glycerol-3-phosphate transport system substrate-binding protein
MAGGKTEMYAGFSWIAGLLRNNAPDLNWIAVPIPTPDGSNQPAYGNMRFAVEAVINPNASKAEKAVAWDFWHFNYSNNDVVRDDLAIFNGFLPPYDALLNDAKILADPLASVMAPLGEFGLINDLPQVVRAEMQELATAVVLDPSDLDGKLVSSQKVQNDLLSKRSDWNIIERNYGNSAKMIQD